MSTPQTWKNGETSHGQDSKEVFKHSRVHSDLKCLAGGSQMSLHSIIFTEKQSPIAHTPVLLLGLDNFLTRACFPYFDPFFYPLELCCPTLRT